jgi:uncharacterized protein
MNNMNWIRWYRLKRYLQKHFALPADSLHGPKHWQKVEQIGLAMARKNGADQEVVKLFAWLHDSCRQNEFTDEQHGERAAKLASQLRGPLLELPDDQFTKLHYAIKHHAHGMICEDATVGTCWDADRLDLARTGTSPSEEYMSTNEGKRLLVSM